MEVLNALEVLVVAAGKWLWKSAPNIIIFTVVWDFIRQTDGITVENIIRYLIISVCLVWLSWRFDDVQKKSREK